MAGWIKLHRKLLKNPVVMKDGDHLAVWIYLLLNAQHENYDTLFGGKKITLKPGQLITGRKKIARDLKISESKVRRVLDALKSEHQIDQQAERYGSLITIVEWDKYQKRGQQNGQQMTNDRPTTDQRPTTIQEGEEDKEEGDFVPPSSADVFSFFQEHNYISDPDQFFNWYNLNNWTKSNGDPVTDWEQMARSWEQREKQYAEERKGKGGKSKAPFQPEPPQYRQFEPEPEIDAEPADPELMAEMKKKLKEAIT